MRVVGYTVPGTIVCTFSEQPCCDSQGLLVVPNHYGIVTWGLWLPLVPPKARGHLKAHLASTEAFGLNEMRLWHHIESIWSGQSSDYPSF